MAIELLPVEVVDLILSFLHSDMDTLTACAQSHLILSRLSKRYIYVEITLCDDLYGVKLPTDHRTSKFAQTLATKSDLANHVRRLTVAWVNGDPGSEQHNAAFAHLDGVATLLPMFVGLTTLSLEGNFTNDDCVKWDSIPGTFRQAFLHLVRPQLSLKEIVISQIAFFPMSLLNNCRNVKIILMDCEYTQYEKESTNPEDVLRPSPVPFEHLSIRRCTETCQKNIAPWVTVYGLRSLEYVHFTGNSFEQFLVACSTYLTKLDLRIFEILTHFSDDPGSHPNGDRVIHFPFTLASLRHLTQLSIDTYSSIYHFRPEGEEGPWAMNTPIPAILELISTAWPALKKMFIKIMFAFTVDEDGPQQLPDPAVVWSPFIPLATKCSSASITMRISPSFDFRICDSDIRVTPDFGSLLVDFKGLTPYVQKGVVTISEMQPSTMR